MDPLTSNFNFNDHPEYSTLSYRIEKQQAFPFTETTAPSLALKQENEKGLKNYQVSDISDEKLNGQLEDLLGTQQEKIEQSLESLEQSEQIYQVLQSTTSAQRTFNGHINIAKDIASNLVSSDAVELLAKIFPPDIIRNYAAEHFEKTSTVISLIGTFLSVVDTAATGTILICRAKLLKEAIAALNKVQQEVEKGEIQLTLEQKQALKQWKANLDFEKQLLAYDAAKYSLRVVKRTFSHIRIIAKFLPSDSPLVQATGPLQGLGWAAGGILWILSLMNLSKLSVQYADYNRWTTDLKNSSLAVKSKELLEKRETFNEQVKKLHQERDRNSETLKNRLDAFQTSLKQPRENKIKKLTQLENQLNNEKIKESDAQKELKMLGITVPTGTTKSDYLQLIKSQKTEASEWLKLFEKQVSEDPDFILKSYVQHQGTISQVLKSSLKRMVEKKLELERCFLRFRLIESSTLFTILTISLTVSAIVIIAGLSLTPPGAAILLGLTIGSAVISLGFTISGHFLSYKKKPTLWRDVTEVDLKAKLARIVACVEEFSRQLKYKRLVKKAQAIRTFQNDIKDFNKKSSQDQIRNSQKLIKEFEKAKETYWKQCEKVKKWNDKVQDLQDRLLRDYWEDFSRHAQLSETTFSHLLASKRAFQALDLELIDEETKSFLEKYLNIDIIKMRSLMKEDPRILQKTLQKFFSFSDADLIFFIERQNVLLAAKP
jgi:hypothetical protein